MKILIIDDSLLDRKLIINLLKKEGIENEILQASDGEEGLKVLSANFSDIKLILLDWQMPNLDGIEFLKAIINVPQVSNIPIVMISASSADEDKELAKNSNPNLAAYVVKPYSKETLLNAVRPLLKKS